MRLNLLSRHRLDPHLRQTEVDVCERRCRLQTQQPADTRCNIYCCALSAVRWHKTHALLAAGTGVTHLQTVEKKITLLDIFASKQSCVFKGFFSPYFFFFKEAAGSCERA